MRALLKHIEKQQGLAVNLVAVIRAASIIDCEELDSDTVTGLLNVAGDLANRLNEGLDSVNLPEVDA